MKILQKIKNIFADTPAMETTNTVAEVVEPVEVEAKVIEVEATPETPANADVPTLWDAFTQKYPNDANRILKPFEAANQCPATWENLTKYRLQSFVNYLAERIAPNSVHQYCKLFKVVLNMYCDDVELPRGYAKILSPKKQKTTKIWLNEEEIQRLIDYTPKNANETLVRNQFLMGCLTGARFSDFTRFDEGNIVEGKLTYVSQKTKTPTTVPLHPVVPELIAKTEKREMSERGFNECIRRICQKCNIRSPTKVFRAGREQSGEKWEFVSSHTARRSFASNLYLRGVDIYSICKLMGHSNIDITQGYIVCGLRELSSEAMGYFEN
ncbi:MAG: site-specific integrase [Bacteroides sp.]|nr:site-specific integrase [Bacteroides sp.]